MLVSRFLINLFDNDPINNRCVGVTPLRSGSGFTADVYRLGVRVSSSRQGLVGLGLALFARGGLGLRTGLVLALFARGRYRVTGHRQGRSGYPEPVRMRAQPEMEVCDSWSGTKCVRSKPHYNY